MFRKELRALLRLAAPLVAGFVGTQLMGFVDTAMVGRLGAAAMGGTGIGGGIFFALSIVALGCAMGIDPLVTQAVGAGEPARARRIYWHGLRVSVAVSLPLMAGILILAPTLLAGIGVEPEIARATRAYLWGRVWNTIPLALFAAARSYLQATDHTRAIVMSTVVANILNFFADAILIYGDGALHAIGLPGIGLPSLGPFGAGLASSLAAAASTLVLFSAIAKIDVPPDPERRKRDRALERKILALGLPIGLQMLVEVAAFAGASALSGRIGITAAAGNQIALSLASMSFMVPLGISSATAVRVGHAVGRSDRDGARRAGLAGFAAGVSFMGLAALAFLLFPDPLARILTDKEEVIAAAVPLIGIAAFFQLFDGMQVVGAGALRGTGETRSTLAANVVGYLVVGLPLAVLLAFHGGMGARGLWWGLSAGLTTVGVTLISRFLVVSARPIQRIAADLKKGE